MKRIVLTAVNSRFTHLNPAVRLLAAMAPHCTRIVEGTLQDPLQRQLAAIMSHRPDAVGFSGYIWNRERMLQLAQCVKSLSPETVILLGGPEFSSEDEGFLNRHPFVDLILPGEGEAVYAAWLEHWERTGSPLGAPGTLCRGLPFVHGPLPEMDSLPFAYANELPSLRGRSVYYETSRGCPGRCAFCLSGSGSPPRFMALDKVERELTALFEAEVAQIKLVDRTFNCHPRRAVQIMDRVLELDRRFGREGRTNVHMEIRGDRMDESFLRRLEQAPEGLFQLEIGVQSTHGPTREAIHRDDDLALLARNVHRIRSMGNTHLHLDLIAGLPCEDMTAFGHSFDEILAMEPHVLQLGFLKVLPGSELHRRAGEWGLRFAPFPPYEVLSTPWMSHGELALLRDVEAVLEWTFNAQAGLTALREAQAALGEGAFALFVRLARSFRDQGLMDRPLSLEARYSGLYRALQELIPPHRLEGLLRHDWACHGKPHQWPGPLASRPPQDPRALTEQHMEGFLAPIAALPAARRAQLCHAEAYDPPLILGGVPARTVLYLYSEHPRGPRRCRQLPLP